MSSDFPSPVHIPDKENNPAFDDLSSANFPTNEKQSSSTGSSVLESKCFSICQTDNVKREYDPDALYGNIGDTAAKELPPTVESLSKSEPTLSPFLAKTPDLPTLQSTESISEILKDIGFMSQSANSSGSGSLFFWTSNNAVDQPQRKTEEDLYKESLENAFADFEAGQFTGEKNEMFAKFFNSESIEDGLKRQSSFPETFPQLTNIESTQNLVLSKWYSHLVMNENLCSILVQYLELTDLWLLYQAYPLRINTIFKLYDGILVDDLSNPQASIVFDQNGLASTLGHIQDAEFLHDQHGTRMPVIRTPNQAYAVIVGPERRVICWGSPGKIVLSFLSIYKTGDLVDVVDVKTTASAFACYTEAGRGFIWGEKYYGGTVNDEHKIFLTEKIKEVHSSFTAFLFMREDNLAVISRMPFSSVIKDVKKVCGNNDSFCLLKLDSTVECVGCAFWGGAGPGFLLKDIEDIWSTDYVFYAKRKNGDTVSWGYEHETVIESNLSHSKSVQGNQ